ncbi:MAG: TlpA family protein disulfide reductase [Clostridiales bacterium]|nr:TlpA family protein disulfide reductase [Clostridiales bacterium]
MVQKIASILLILCLLFGLGACGAEQQPPPPKDEAVQQETPAPEEGEEIIPILSTFTAPDFDGNTIDQSYLAEKKLTMVNIWATTCGFCIEEMPDLAALNAQYADQGFQVMGIVTDVMDRDGSFSESQVEKAKEIVEKQGADYLQLLPSEDLIAVILAIPSNSVPLTFFVNEKGELVGKIYAGALGKEAWEEMILEHLAEEE